jgi:uncharacterized protein YndB with AHSA1/START domain
MTKGDDPDAWKTGRGFVVERVFDAPRGLVFKAWTEPERLKRWWGPDGDGTRQGWTEMLDGLAEYLAKA